MQRKRKEGKIQGRMETFYRLAENRQSRKPFISCEEGSLDYKDFFSLCKRAYKALNGLSPGEILLFCNKAPEKLLSFLMAALKREAHFLLAYENLSEWEYEHLKRKIRPHYEISKEGKLKSLYCSAARLNLPAGVIFQTSGSKGPSSFVYHSEKNLLENAERAGKYQEITEDSKAFVPITLSHTGGINMQTLAVFISGGEVYFSSGKGFLRLKKFFKENFTHAVLVPPHLRYILNSPQWKEMGAFQTQTLILTGSCPVSHEFYKMVGEKNGRLLGVYGMTEIGPFVSVMEKEFLNNYEDLFPIGKSHPDFEMKLSKKKEILIKGPSTGKYIERTKTGWKVLNCGDPWVHSGDKGVKKGDIFYYRGRLKREINLGGFKINPEKIEEILKQHPKVSNCLVYAETDPLRHEIPVVKIVSNAVSVSELKSFLVKRVGHLNIPRKWLFTDHLNQTSIGKVKAQ